MEFHRTSRRTKQLPLTPLIDVVFLLLIFFMVSTTFVKTESMELSLPSLSEAKKVDDSTLHIYVGNDGSLFMGSNAVPEVDLADILKKEFSKNSNKRILLQTANRVSVQKLVSVMDLIYLSGGRNLSVADWREASAP